MARCDHSRGNIQQFTEVCLDCGHNIYETDTEYEASLEKDVRFLQSELTKQRIKGKEALKEKLERELRELKGESDDENNGNW
jgi:formyltetrahydrofolate hydrolase